MLAFATGFCACAKAPIVPVRPEPAATRAPPEEVDRCFTVRDAERSCQRACGPLQPEVDRCYAAVIFQSRGEPRPSGRLTIRLTGTSSGAIRNVEFEARPAPESGDFGALERCLRGVFRHFTPCLPMSEGEERTIPLVFSPGSP